MSSSNLAVRLEPTATDVLSQPQRLEARKAANDERVVKGARRRLSLTNRKLVARDQGMQLFRIR